MKKYFKFIIIAISMFAVVPQLRSQTDDVIQIQALFEYPVAPENIEGLTEKSNWLVAHFWDPMDFHKSSVDQTALDHAFQVFCTPIQYAEKNFVDLAIGDLLKKLEGNSTLRYQFVLAAENNLYGPRAVAWVDEVYTPFLENIVKDKKLSKKRLDKYKRQLDILKTNIIGGKLPMATFTSRDGKKAKFDPKGKKSLIVFTRPGDVASKMYKVKLSVNSDVQNAIEQGALNVCFFTVGEPSDAWKADMADYPQEWIVGASPDFVNVFDLRISPSVFIADQDGKLLGKNFSLEYALSQLF